MAVGSYGTKRPSDVDPSDVEIFYHYVSGRTDSITPVFKKLTSTDVLIPLTNGDITDTNYEGEDTEIIGGLYNLKLDSSNFSNLGIYTIYLRPKQIRCVISDCGVLAALPSVRGIVVDLSSIKNEDDRNKFTTQGLVGYRVEYLDDNGKKSQNFYRIVTSSFYCEPIVSNLTNSTQKAIRYVYTDRVTNLVFLTLTPSSSPTTRPNVVPYIGQPNQKIILSNTFFNPLMVEVEMVEHDATTLANALYGNQSKSMNDGIYTIYDSNNNIYKQFNLYEKIDEYGDTLFEIREERDSIDETLTLSNIKE